MPLHIGIVACSAEGAALCYRAICQGGPELLGAHTHPEISLHSHSLGDYMECIYRDDWRGVGELMLSSANKLAEIGADFLICPDNTVHQALPYIEQRLPLEWLHIAEAVATEAASRRFLRLGLTGTRYLVDSDVYPVEFVRPNPEERQEINRIIMDELVCGVFKPTAVATFQRVMGRMKDEGCDAVISAALKFP
jgi:aspartate racemase